MVSVSCHSSAVKLSMHGAAKSNAASRGRSITKNPTGVSQKMLRLLLIGVMLSVLNACASIPLPTAMRLASWSEQDLVRVDPAQVRVRLSTPAGFLIDVPKAKLRFALTDSAGRTHEASLPLRLLLQTEGMRSGGWFASDVPVNTSVLALTAKGAVKLRELQQSMLVGEPRKFSINVSTAFSKMPPNAQKVTFWADLRIAEGEPYVALIDGAEIIFDRD